MIKNILLYIFILTSAFVFNIFYYAWFSWFLFIIVLCLPYVSLIASLPFMIKSAVNGFMLFGDDEIYADDKMKIGLVFKKQNFSFCPRIKVKLRVNNSFADTHTNLKIVHSGNFSQPFFTVCSNLGKLCGCCEFRVKHCRVYDFLGIFFIPAKINKGLKTFVMPKPQTPQNLPDFENVTVLGYKPKSGGGFSDYYELRQYQSGDSLKSIHWKLSSKHDNLIVREPSQPIIKQFAINAVLSKNSEQNKSILSRLIYVCNYINEQGSVCYAFADGYDGVSEINNNEDIKMFIKALYLRTTYNSSELDRNNAIIYRITDEGEEVQSA